MSQDLNVISINIPLDKFGVTKFPNAMLWILRPPKTIGERINKSKCQDVMNRELRIKKEAECMHRCLEYFMKQCHRTQYMIQDKGSCRNIKDCDWSVRCDIIIA